MRSPARYRIDPETLREIVDNPGELTAWLDAALARPADRPLYTERGVAARLLGRLDVAERELAAALRLQDCPLARTRLAVVYQWQGRHELAETEFARALAESQPVRDQEHFIWQHAGTCAYETGDWPTALTRCATALRLRTESRLGDELVASASLSVDAAGACATARAAAIELHRLVPAVYRAMAACAADLFAAHGRPPHPGLLLELGPFTGAIPLPVVRGLHRHADGLDQALAGLQAGGWLRVDPDAVVVTDRGRGLLRASAERRGALARSLWPRASAALHRAREAVHGAHGTSAEPAFDALAAAVAPTGDAGELFDLLHALRQHRADAHAAAGRAAGLDTAALRALPEGDPIRRQVDAETDRVAARVFRAMPAAHRTEFLGALRALPGG